MYKIFVFIITIILLSGFVSAQMPPTTTTTFITPLKSGITQPKTLSNNPTLFKTVSSTITVNSNESIQDAIDTSNPGDTIKVAAGTYNEKIIITKSIEIIGENKDTTIINGGNKASGNCVHIFADNIEVTGFTLTNCFSGAVTVWSTNVTLSNLDIYDVQNGIVMMESDEIIAQDNIITGNIYGIVQQTSDKSQIINNKILENTLGIWLYSSSENRV